MGTLSEDIAYSHSTKTNRQDSVAAKISEHMLELSGVSTPLEARSSKVLDRNIAVCLYVQTVIYPYSIYLHFP